MNVPLFILIILRRWQQHYDNLSGDLRRRIQQVSTRSTGQGIDHLWVIQLTGIWLFDYYYLFKLFFENIQYLDKWLISLDSLLFAIIKWLITIHITSLRGHRKGKGSSLKLLLSTLIRSIGLSRSKITSRDTSYKKDQLYLTSSKAPFLKSPKYLTTLTILKIHLPFRWAMWVNGTDSTPPSNRQYTMS